MSEKKFQPMSSIMSVNGFPYKQVGGEWIPDEEARKQQLEREAEEQKAKDDLIFAARTRLLTDEEMAEVRRQGTNLFVRMNGGMSNTFYQDDVEKRLNELMAQQFQLRMIADNVKKLS